MSFSSWFHFVSNNSVFSSESILTEKESNGNESPWDFAFIKDSLGVLVFIQYSKLSFSFIIVEKKEGNLK